MLVLTQIGFVLKWHFGAHADWCGCTLCCALIKTTFSGRIKLKIRVHHDESGFSISDLASGVQIYIEVVPLQLLETLVRWQKVVFEVEMGEIVAIEQVGRKILQTAAGQIY